MSALLEHNDFVVRRRPKVFELRVGYDLYDAQGVTPLGSVEQVGRDNLEKTLHPRKSDNARTPLELREPSGVLVLLLTHAQALRSSLLVHDAAGGDLGRIDMQNLLGKRRLTLNVAGVIAGTVAAETWRNKNFAIVDLQGTEVASIDLTHGSSADRSHDNQYAARLDPRLDAPMRALAFVAVIAIDMIIWTR